MKFIKKCAVSALCLSLLAGTAASLNVIPASITAPTAITAEAAGKTPNPGFTNPTPSDVFVYSNGYYTLSKDGKGATFAGTRYVEDQTFKVPAYVYKNGTRYPVTEVGYRMAIPITTRMKNVVNLTLPDSITIINDWAFTSSNLTTLNFVDEKGNASTPKNIVEIGRHAFNSCKITNFRIEECTKLSIIKDHAFANLPNCPASSSTVKYNDSVEVIRSAAFLNNTNMVTFTMSGKYSSLLYKIEDDVFKGCKNLRNVNFNNIYRSMEIGATNAGAFDLTTLTYAKPLVINVNFKATGKNYRALTFKNAAEVKAILSGKIAFKGLDHITIYDNNGNEITKKVRKLG